MRLRKSIFDPLQNACWILIASLAIAQVPAQADEFALADLDADVRAQLLAEAVERALANADHYSPPADRIRLPKLRPSIVSFAEECAELDAIPLFDLSKDDSRRVFVALSFDGFLGIHGRL